MLYTTSVMADQVGEYSVNNTIPLETAFSVSAVKEEECKDDLVDDKVQIFETAIIAEVQDYLIYNTVKHDISTTLDSIKTEEQSLPEVQYDVMQVNVKVEEEISTNDVRIEFNNVLLYCEDCQVYREDYCAECGMLVHILNKTVPVNIDTKVQEALPNDYLEIRDYFGEYHIFAAKVIPAGVKFGPFTGLNAVDHPWKIKGGKFVVNKAKSQYLNWMQYINPARNIFEQNLQVFQYEHNLYYESTRRIEKGDELLVHFGEEYEDSLNRNVEVDFMPKLEHIFKDTFACTFCCLGFSSESYLLKHKAICPRNTEGGFSVEELTQCPFCKIHLGQKEYSECHMAYCCERNDIKCLLPPTSDRRFERFDTGQVRRLSVETTPTSADDNHDFEHIVEERRLKEYKHKCDMCDYKANWKSSLNAHVKTRHSNEFKYKCDTCDYRTNRNATLKIHIETKHLKEFKYKCETCDYKSNFKNHLKTHIETKHLKEFKYKCDICDYKTSFKNHLMTHIETRHLKEFKYKCDGCDYKTNFKNHLKTHRETRHLKEFKHKCDLCDYKANVKSGLKRHVQAMHLKECKYKCDACAYKTNQKFILKRHIEAKHLHEFKYKCDACDYKSNWKSWLKSHVEAKHLTEYKYKCDTCEYKTNIKPSLKIHIETKHLSEFKYKCDKCDYKTYRKDYLRKHVETRHLKECKYKCDTCDYKTNNMSNLKNHVKGTHS